MSEFQGHCQNCTNYEDVSANKPCKLCGGTFNICSVDGLTDDDFDPEPSEKDAI